MHGKAGIRAQQGAADLERRELSRKGVRGLPATILCSAPIVAAVMLRGTARITYGREGDGEMRKKGGQGQEQPQQGSPKR